METVIFDISRTGGVMTRYGRFIAFPDTFRQSKDVQVGDEWEVLEATLGKKGNVYFLLLGERISTAAERQAKREEENRKIILKWEEERKRAEEQRILEQEAEKKRNDIALRALARELETLPGFSVIIPEGQISDHYPLQVAYANEIIRFCFQFEYALTLEELQRFIERLSNDYAKPIKAVQILHTQGYQDVSLKWDQGLSIFAFGRRICLFDTNKMTVDDISQEILAHHPEKQEQWFAEWYARFGPLALTKKCVFEDQAMILDLDGFFLPVTYRYVDRKRHEPFLLELFRIYAAYEEHSARIKNDFIEHPLQLTKEYAWYIPARSETRLVYDRRADIGEKRVLISIDPLRALFHPDEGYDIDPNGKRIHKRDIHATYEDGSITFGYTWISGGWSGESYSDDGMRFIPAGWDCVSRYKMLECFPARVVE